MKKIKVIFLLISLLTLTSCGILIGIEGINQIADLISGNTCTVTFVYNNGEQNLEVDVNKGEFVKKPTDPIKENYCFNGWYVDYACEREFDFSTTIEYDMTLYAGYILDNTKTTITESILQTNVTIELEEYNKTFGIVHKSQTITGSGVIFKHTDSTYYVLTNNHVIYKDSDFQYHDYYVYDYKGNKYKSELVKSNYDVDFASYDLAIVKFNTSKEYNVIEMADENPNVFSKVTAIGQPNGIPNTVTTGVIKKYDKVSLDDGDKNESNVNFDIIVHTAEIHSGSSGGALLNSDLKLIGINYAGAEISEKFVYGYAIPIIKVKEFLTYFNL